MYGGSPGATGSNLPVPWWDSVTLTVEVQFMALLSPAERRNMSMEQESAWWRYLISRHRLYLRRAYLQMLTEMPGMREAAAKLGWLR